MLQQRIREREREHCQYFQGSANEVDIRILRIKLEEVMSTGAVVNRFVYQGLTIG